MRRDRMTLPTFLMAVLLAVLVSFSCVMCLKEAFGMAANTGLLLAVCCGSSLLASFAMAPRRSWPFVLAGGLVYLAVVLWKRALLLESLEYLLFRISREYAACFQGLQIVGSTAGDAEWILAALGIPLAWLTAWVTSREGSAVLVIMACLPVLILCLIIVELAPVLWLILLIGALMVLVISHSVRERSPAEGSRLAWWLVLPTIILISGITVLWPPADYVRADWSDALQTVAEAQIELEAWQEEIFSDAPRWSRELKEVDLSRVGPKVLTGTHVLDYRTDASLSYLRGVSLGVYSDNSWEAVSSAAYQAQGSSGTPLVQAWTGSAMLEVKTRTREPQLYTTYYLAEVPADAQPVDDAYVQNTLRITEYTMRYEPYLQKLTQISADYEQFAMEQYLQIPEELRQPLTELVLAAGLQGASADAVADFVRSSGVYDLNTPRVPDGKDFVLYFLQESHQGYCVHFASAATMLLRSVGIPARYVTGYAVNGPVNEWNAVTEDEAHAWVEYYTAGLGWRMLDPTPAAAVEPDEPEQITEGISDETETPEIQTPEEVQQNQDVPEQTTAQKPSAAEKQTAWPRALLWLLAVPGLALAVWLRRWLGLRYRRERCTNGHPNRQALTWWRWLVQLSKAGNLKIPEELLCLAEKARFSQHTMQPEELAVLQQAVESRIEELRKTPAGKRFWYRYVLVLF